MKKINLEFLFPLAALAIGIFSLSQQIFIAPPLGKLLDPFIGLAQNQEDGIRPASRLVIAETGLKKPVHVFFDNRKVPHIYASNTEDLYFAQGYVTAYLRLWQMDFLTYASAGRLSELFNEGFFDYDRNQRRIGMLEAAKKSLEMINNDSETRKVITAYSRGVNAYIRQLNYRTMPFEYKFLDYEPEPWSNLKTVLILKHMAGTLSGYEKDLTETNLMVALGEQKFNKYFPNFIPYISPVVHDSALGPNPSLAYTKKPDYLDYLFLSSSSVISSSAYNPALGSNSWAVSGKKTKSGFPILCSDPHLGLSLPAIWLEMQLTAPGLNVYGVSIPGTPSVIIGFNENIAWGLTNGSDDVKDWYKLKITRDYKKYKLDDQWLDLPFRVEEIKRKGQKAFYDTIYYTVHGPIVSSENFPGPREDLMDHALKWEMHAPSNEFLTFIKLSKAKNYQEYKEAIKHYSCPIQNFTFAGKDNTIAIHHQGNMAVKWPGQGKFILDGTRSSHLYTKYIPVDSLPYVHNPPTNYVLSANQHPTSSNYSYYYSGNYVESRANRIKQLLHEGRDFDIQKMKAMQLDNVSFFAREALPSLLKAIDRRQLNAGQLGALQRLADWNGAYDADDKNAVLYEMWWNNTKDLCWDEFENYTFSAGAPDDYVLLDLIRQEPANEYFDKQGSTARENASDIVLEAFRESFAEYSEDLKLNDVKWASHHKVSLGHLLGIEQFSRNNLPVGGYPGAINAMSGSWGPSWRMIVELGPRPKAVGIYAGGQSGNVGSAHYDSFINDWNKGEYYDLLFFMSINEAKEKAAATWTLN